MTTKDLGVKQSFSLFDPYLMGALVGFCFVRVALARYFPVTNDEAYYWDWSRSLALSYLDHPPAVAWLGYLSRIVMPIDGLDIRFFSPLVHSVSTLIMVAVALEWPGQKNQKFVAWATFLLIQLVPGFSLLGALLLPDTMLFLGLSLTLFFAQKVADSAELDLFCVIALGVAAGIAILSKFHALVIVPGILFWAFAQRYLREMNDWSALAITFTVAMFVSSPLWIWNSLNEFASFKFQSAHGFAGLKFNSLFFSRVLVGHLLYLTPFLWFSLTRFVVINAFKFASFKCRTGLFCWVVFLPLASILLSVAPFKQTLPHWVMPAFWLLVPVFVNFLNEWSLATRVSLSMGSVCCFALPWLLALSPMKAQILKHFRGNPGSLSELTLWPDLGAQIEKKYGKRLQTSTDEGCENKVVLGSFRWFWVAQMSYHLEGNPKVISLDLNHNSYYRYRDSRLDLSGCEVVLVGDRRHFDRDAVGSLIDIGRIEPLKIPFHEKLPVILIEGRFKNRDSLVQISLQ